MQSVQPTSALPLRHEDEATGLVAAIFADVRRRMSFVPALFKALAVDPDALEQAWLQARALYDDPRSKPAAATLLEVAAGARLPYRAPSPVRRAVTPFVRELPSMLLIVTSLRLAVDGDLPRRPRPSKSIPPAVSAPEPVVPESREEHPLFEEIRATYGTTYVPSMFRSLSAQGLLEDPWGAIGPFLASPAGVGLARKVAAAAEEAARGFPEVAFFDAESGRPVIDQFSIALPRNLVFAVAASTV